MVVWVLTNETVPLEWEEAGGCVCGVYTSREAAQYDLAWNVLGADWYAELEWTWTHDGYGEGWHARTEALYVLQQKPVQTQDALHAAVAAERQRIADMRTRAHG